MAVKRWRVGRKVGRTIYEMVGGQPSDNDVLIGMMDTRKLAAEVVHDHNGRCVESTDAPPWEPPDDPDADPVRHSWGGTY